MKKTVRFSCVAKYATVIILALKQWRGKVLYPFLYQMYPSLYSNFRRKMASYRRVSNVPCVPNFFKNISGRKKYFLVGCSCKYITRRKIFIFSNKYINIVGYWGTDIFYIEKWRPDRKNSVPQNVSGLYPKLILYPEFPHALL